MCDRLQPVYQKERRETLDLVSHDRIVIKVVSYKGLICWWKYHGLGLEKKLLHGRKGVFYYSERKLLII